MGNVNDQDSISTPPYDRTLVKWTVIPLLRAYRAILSPALAVLGSRCRFYPSCSVYSMEAFQVHGLVRGFWLSISRLAKCNPLHSGGFDPVPPNQRHLHCNHEHSGTQRNDAVNS